MNSGRLYDLGSSPGGTTNLKNFLDSQQHIDYIDSMFNTPTTTPTIKPTTKPVAAAVTRVGSPIKDD